MSPPMAGAVLNPSESHGRDNLTLAPREDSTTTAVALGEGRTTLVVHERESCVPMASTTVKTVPRRSSATVLTRAVHRRRMQLGATVGGFYDRIGTTATAHGDGFEFLELSVGGDAVRIDEVDTTALADRLDELGLDRTVHLPTIHPYAVPVTEIRRAALDYQTRALDTAAALGASKAATHADTDPRDRGDETLLADTVAELAARGHERGVEVCVENLGHLDKGFDIWTVGEAAASAGVSLCLDIGHAYLEVGNDGLDAFLGSHADLVSHVHVHDARERGDSHVPLGSGGVDPTAATTLADHDPTVAVEVFTDDWRLLWDTAVRFRNAVAGD
jgi:sugar phosphate isomerase/epimerase